MHRKRRQGFEIAYLRELDRAGVFQTDVAASMDRHPSTLSRMLNSRDDDYRCHASDLPAMFAADDGACLRALDVVLASCGDGFRVVPVPREEPADLIDGALGLQARLGQFTADLRGALSQSGPGGRSITRMELEQLKRDLKAAQRDIDAILAGIDAHEAG